MSTSVAAAVIGVGGTVIVAVAGLWANVRNTNKTTALAHRALKLTEQGQVTDQYTKAVGQLGSDNAPVRLGALYALERFAQDNPEHRQTTVNVICAYLRMPFPSSAPANRSVSEPGEGAGEPAPAAEMAASADSSDSWRQERQVRLTAQRVLSEHLRKTPPDTQPSADPAIDRFWPGIRLDLTGATLIDFALETAVLAEGLFIGVTFRGDASFRWATFTGAADFVEATFGDHAWFSQANFRGDTSFREAIFSGDASFRGVTFTGIAWFSKATFSGSTTFREATFGDDARFDGATFNGDAGFGEATFSGDVWFGQIFNGGVVYEGATFSGGARFDGVTFSGGTRFDGATFSGGKGATSFARSLVRSSDAHHVWPEGWCTGTSDGGHTVVRAGTSDRGSGNPAPEPG
jgi:uncharacterized protein YjbI with pentapeptide repeats